MKKGDTCLLTCCLISSWPWKKFLSVCVHSVFPGSKWGGCGKTLIMHTHASVPHLQLSRFWEGAPRFRMIFINNRTHSAKLVRWEHIPYKKGRAHNRRTGWSGMRQLQKVWQWFRQGSSSRNQRLGTVRSNCWSTRQAARSGESTAREDTGSRAGQGKAQHVTHTHTGQDNKRWQKIKREK